MANAKLLNEKFIASGKTKTHLAHKMNVSRPRLDTILESPDTATVVQADILASELNLLSAEKKEIFLP